MRTRLKMRCLSVTRDWKGRRENKLAPVTDSVGLTHDAQDENKTFWSATPAGELTLTTRSDAFEPGEFYYVDVERLGKAVQEGDKRSWALTTLTHHVGIIEAAMSLYWASDGDVESGSFRASITNEQAWEIFQGHLGKPWSISFTPAPS